MSLGFWSLGVWSFGCVGFGCVRFGSVWFGRECLSFGCVRCEFWSFEVLRFRELKLGAWSFGFVSVQMLMHMQTGLPSGMALSPA